MKSIKGQLDYAVYVKCPKCGHSFDILSEDDQDEEGCISRPLFENNWDKCSDSTTCPECEFKFKMVGVEY